MNFKAPAAGGPQRGSGGARSQISAFQPGDVLIPSAAEPPATSQKETKGPLHQASSNSPPSPASASRSALAVPSGRRRSLRVSGLKIRSRSAEGRPNETGTRSPASARPIWGILLGEARRKASVRRGSKATHLLRVPARPEASPKQRRGRRRLGEHPGREKRGKRDSAQSSPPSAGKGCEACLEKELKVLQEPGMHRGFQPRGDSPVTPQESQELSHRRVSSGAFLPWEPTARLSS